MERKISDMLECYTARGLAPWHMPGHKRKAVLGGFWDDLFERDVTEVPGTDDYHHPEGAILESQQQAAEVYGVAYSHYLVGGSTAGILAGVLALAELWRESAEQKEELPVFLVAGNVHRSVWNALRLAGAAGVVLKPETDPYYGPILPETVESVLEELREGNRRIAGCVITSPTYGGTISCLKEIHDILKKEGIPLFVDEAHGAHLCFCDALREHSAVTAGAELVVQSLHKTMPALTQTGILHVNGDASDERTERFNRVLKEKLAVVQSSSPSYLLLSSAEQAVAWGDEHRADFGPYLERLAVFRNRLRENLQVMELADFAPIQDPTRVFLRAPGGTAEWLERETGVVVELAGSREMILISTIMDEEDDLEHLYEALIRADAWLKEAQMSAVSAALDRSAAPQTAVTLGETAPEDIYVYPPGVLILKKGDRVTEEARRKIEEERAAGRKVYGVLP